MPRARNIKHSFFSNDELADCEPLARLLFIGLWTIADFKGCIEWRPKKIKAQLLPYDNCDIIKLMISLDKSRFVISYSDGNKVYIKIRKFSQHQHPHPNEIKKGSDIPDCTENMSQSVDSNTLIINHDKSRLISDDSITNPSDSCIPITDSCIPLREGEKKKRSKRFVPPPYEEVLSHCNDTNQTERFINHYESNGWKVGRNKMVNWKACLTNWMKRQEDYKNENNKRSNTGNSRNLSAVERVRRATSIDDSSIIDITPHGYSMDKNG